MSASQLPERRQVAPGRPRESDRRIIADDRGSHAAEAEDAFIASGQEHDVGVSQVAQLRSMMQGTPRRSGAWVRTRSRRRRVKNRALADTSAGGKVTCARVALVVLGARAAVVAR